ncbi:MAG: hypothetical protein WCI73_01790 [Phycisphaerae bacterium]
MRRDPTQGKSRGTASFRWKEAEGQAAWFKIGLAFLAFYVGEAILFWHGGLVWAAPLMRLPLSFPLLYPLGYWGLFGFIVYRLQRKKSAAPAISAAARLRRWQGALLTAVITIGVIGLTFVVMLRSGSTTLGHIAMFFALFLSAAVIGAMELNLGWLAAAGFWLLTALVIHFYPADWHLTRPFKDEDIWLGLSLVIGFFLIGGFRQQVDRNYLHEHAGDDPTGQ